MTRTDSATSRRGFLAGGLAAAVGAASMAASRLEAAPRPAPSDPDRWIDEIEGRERLLLDSPVIRDATVLFSMLNYYQTYETVYGRADGDVAAVAALYGPTAPFALDDAIWARYRLGEFAEILEADGGAPATRNPWRVDPLVRGKLLPQAGIEVLQARGAKFLVCDIALGGLAARLTKARGGSARALHDEFRAGVLPGIIRVPNIVVSIQRAQQRGVPYFRL